MSLFNRPTWAKAPPSTADVDDDHDHDSQPNIFSHSDRSYREIVAEQERKKQAKLERKKAKEDKELRKSLGKRHVSDATYEDTNPKRRRTSGPEEDEGHVTFVGEKSEKRDGQSGEFLQVGQQNDDIVQETAKPRRSPRKSKTAVYEDGPARQEIASPQVIDLGNSDDEDDNDAPVVQPLAAEVIEEDSDDEFAALARRARAQRQQGSNGTSHSTRTADVSADSRAATTKQHPATPDHTVQLLITCSLEGTNPMIIYRKLSQNLEDVRKVWCARQGFSEEATKDIFFIHRLQMPNEGRVYDVTTCRSLGLEVDAWDNLTLKGVEGKENVDKVHLEAVTEDIFRQMKADRAKGGGRSKEEDGATAGAEDEAADKQTTTPARQEECLIRLLLKAKGREDYKLKVRPVSPQCLFRPSIVKTDVKRTTTFAKIVAAYSKTQLQPGQAAHLEFDGERLPPDAEVQDTEVSDMDCIDVHISS